MQLILIRHGSYLDADKDPTKGLSAKGKEEIKLISNYIKNLDSKFYQIWHSGKKRTKESAKIISANLINKNKTRKKELLTPLEDPRKIIHEINTSKEDNLVLVSHLPLLNNLSSLLINGALNPYLFEFTEGSLLHLQKKSSLWQIKAYVPPSAIDLSVQTH